ncbi:MAG: type II secretion system F family protein [Candidatus Eremiobacteraeota bacterium]|nr:type II secretion system F family protein [Candidatus Eremiobacteraeota bacterium]
MIDPSRQETITSAMAVMVAALRPDRALILSSPHGQDYQIEGSHGLEKCVGLAEAPLSSTVFRKVFHSAQPLWTADARRHPDFRGASSLQVSEVRSIVAAPLFHPSHGVWGILYADRQARSPAFLHDDLKWLLTCARRLEATLFEGELLDIPLPDKQERARPVVAAAPAPLTAAPILHSTPRSRSVSLFLRSLATMLKVGLPITECFACLARDQEDPRMVEVVEHLATRLHQGRPLSKAMQSFPRVFTAFQVEMVRTGEDSGNLQEVLELLADYHERGQAQSQRLRSALVYPAFVLGLCLLGAVLIPPLLLKGQLEFLQASGATIPWLTRALMGFSAWAAWPGTWLALSLTLGALGWWLAAAPGSQGRRNRLVWLAEGLPVLGPLLRQVMQARLARALYLSLRAGQNLLEGLSQAVRVGGHQRLGQQTEALVESIKSGAGLTEALRQTDCFDSSFLALLEVGEQAGQLESILLGLARVAEEELARWLESLPALIEPLLTMLVGAIVAVFLIATLSPTLSLLKAL